MVENVEFEQWLGEYFGGDNWKDEKLEAIIIAMREAWREGHRNAVRACEYVADGCSDMTQMYIDSCIDAIIVVGELSDE